MNAIYSLLLGLVQGVTEFLPVSSSGHLVIFQKLIPGFSQPGVLFDVILHFGTLFAVLIYFRKVLFKITPRYILLLIAGSLPAVIVGLMFGRQIEEMFSDTKFLSLEFLITAIICFWIDAPASKKEDLNLKNSFVIGIAQAIAIIPAISRSGSTIFAGVRLGIDKKKAAEYSFLLSVPAILGANMLEIVKYKDNLLNSMLPEYTLGFITSFIVGYFSIGFLLKYLKENRFKIFGYYCIAVAAATFLLFK